jgi:outer membrane receptor protein involved in Fe transport
MRIIPLCRTTLAAFIALSPVGSTALAHEPGEHAGGKEDPHDADKKPAKSEEQLQQEQRAIEVTVTAEKPGGESASRVAYGRRELELRPRLRPGDILEAVPGLFAVQHAGGGKANQYFLRGFDADHGTDVAFFVDGAPVNMVSHGHGQGFSDFHFLIPELVVGLEGYKGPYAAQLGDFATAGAVNLRLAEKFDESYAQYSVGQYGIMRGLVIVSPNLGEDFRVVAAAELYKDDGPFLNPEQLERLNITLRATHDLGPRSKVQMTWMSYASSWNGSGQIPARAVCGEGEPQSPPPEAFGAPCIEHFGYVDPTEGGATQRHLAQLAYSTTWDDADWSAMAYFVKYDFKLYSNFTFFAEDPVHGDEIEQNDDRALFGVDARYRKHYHYRGGRFTTTMGVQARFDSIDNALYHVAARERLAPRVKAHVNQTETAFYVEEDMRLRRWLRFILGGRAQRIDVGVDDLLEDMNHLGGRSSGVKGETRFLPKALAIVSPIPALDLFASYGVGFHSNDARGAVLSQNPATLMTRAVGYEVGARVKPIQDLELGVAGFLLDLDSELVWRGDSGGTEAAGATRRYGVELTGRYRIKNWLFADVAATLTHAAYRVDAGNGGRSVALAPTRTLTAGIGARPTFGDFTPFADVRVKSIGARPATEDGSLTAEGFTIVDANLGLRWKRLELALDVENLLDAKWREVQFATDTRLAYEPKVVTGLHYSPGWPFTAIGRATVYFR